MQSRTYTDTDNDMTLSYSVFIDLGRNDYERLVRASRIMPTALNFVPGVLLLVLEVEHN